MNDKFYILDEKERPVGLLSNKLKKACGYYDDEHVEQLEHGLLTLQFMVPSIHPTASLLVTEGFIVYPNEDDEFELFRIKSASPARRGLEHTTKIFAENAAVTDLLGQWIRPVTLNSQTLEQIMTYVLTNTGWELGKVDYAGVNDFVFDDYITSLAAVHLVMDKFGAEIKFRVEWDGLKIKKKYIDVLQKRGEGIGAPIVYGLDLQDVEVEDNTTELFTAVIGVGNADSNGVPMTFKNKTNAQLQVDTTKYERPEGQDWVGSIDALQRYGKNGQHRFYVFKDDKATNDIELFKNSVKKLDEISKPRLTYKMSVTLLEQLAGYSGHKTRLGNTHLIKDTTFQPELILNARIIEKKTSKSDPSRNSVTLGEFQRIYTSNIPEIQRLQSIIRQNQEKWNSGGNGAGTGAHVIANGPRPLVEGDYANFNHSLSIQVTENIHIGYVSVYCESAGQTGTIELRKSDDTVLATRTFTGLVAGENKLNLDFLLTKDIGSYKLYGDFSGNTWRTKGTLEFPYDSGSFKITGTSSPSTYWYFFYNISIGGSGVTGSYPRDLITTQTTTFLNAQGESVFTFDGTKVGMEQLTVGDIDCPTIVNYNNVSGTLYVNPTTGDDLTTFDEAIAGTKKFKTLTQAINSIRKQNDGDITIYLEGNLTDNIIINGYNGAGSITINLQTYTLDGYVKVSSNTNQIDLTNGTIKNKDATYATVWYMRTVHSQISNITVDSRNTADYNFNFSDGGHYNIQNCAGYNAKTTVIRGAYGVLIEATNNKGQSLYGLEARGSATIGGSGTLPDGTSLDKRSVEGGTLNGTWNATPDSGIAPTASTAPITSTFTSTSGDSYRYTVYIGWRNDGTVRQGQWSGNGMHKGLWFFPAIPTTNGGKTITKMTVDLTRLKTSGNATATVTIRYHNYSSKPSNPTDLSVDSFTASFNLGQPRTLTLPQSFVDAFKAGTAKGIALYTTSTATSAYAAFSTVAKLNVTYG